MMGAVSVIPALWVAEAGQLQVQAQPEQLSSLAKILSPNK